MRVGYNQEITVKISRWKIFFVRTEKRGSCIALKVGFISCTIYYKKVLSSTVHEMTGTQILVSEHSSFESVIHTTKSLCS